MVLTIETIGLSLKSICVNLDGEGGDTDDKEQDPENWHKPRAFLSVTL